MSVVAALLILVPTVLTVSLSLMAVPVSLMAVPVRLSALDVFSPITFTVSLSLTSRRRGEGERRESGREKIGS